jgi:CMP-N,N'-diacetyllegionaminic acid synthase
MEVLAIIGARSGSKGVPGKNVRLLAGHPLLSYAVRMVRSCRFVTRTILSTDSEEYAALGRSCGVEVPFLRPSELALDSSTDIEYIRHALDWLEAREAYRPQAVVRLCPTAPFVRAVDLDACVQLLAADTDAHAVIAMAPAREHPRKAARITDDGLHVVSYMTSRGADLSPTSRQAHITPYNRQGLPVVSRVSTIRELGSMTGERIRFHLVPSETAIDIDTEFDFQLAELVMQRMTGGA